MLDAPGIAVCQAPMYQDRICVQGPVSGGPPPVAPSTLFPQCNPSQVASAGMKIDSVIQQNLSSTLAVAKRSLQLDLDSGDERKGSLKHERSCSYLTVLVSAPAPFDSRNIATNTCNSREGEGRDPCVSRGQAGHQYVSSHVTQRDMYVPIEHGTFDSTVPSIFPAWELYGSEMEQHHRRPESSRQPVSGFRVTRERQCSPC